MGLVSGQQSMSWPVLLAGPGLCGVLLNLRPGAVNLELAELLVGCTHTVSNTAICHTTFRRHDGLLLNTITARGRSCLYYYKHTMVTFSKVCSTVLYGSVNSKHLCSVCAYAYIHIYAYARVHLIHTPGCAWGFLSTQDLPNAAQKQYP